MKVLVTTLAFLCGICQAKSQSYEMTPQGNTTELTISIENLYADLHVEGTTGGAIKVEASNYKGLPEKAEGLKPLSATGPDNTEIGLNMVQEGNTVTVSGAHRKADDADYRIIVPKNVKLRIEYNSFQSQDVKVTNMSNEVEIESKTGDVDLEEVMGPIVVSTLSGDITVIFSEVSQTSPTSISSTSGDVDLTLPASTKGNFEMKSMSGEVYTDLDFDIEEEGGMRRLGGGMSADATLNGGGVVIGLRSISGDIYIRKK